MGPRYHQIRPNSHPHATPAPKFEDSLRNSNPKVMPMRELTSRWISSPCQLVRLVSTPATFDSTPVFSMMGAETMPPVNPANAPHPERLQHTQARAMRFAVERIRLNKQPHPDFVESGVAHAKNHPVEDMAHQGAEHGAAVSGGPVERTCATATAKS